MLRRGEITLTGNDSANLEEELVTNGVQHDLYLTSSDPDIGYLTTVRTAMVELEDQPTRAACVDALTARRVDRLPVAELGAGSWVCITTEEGNVAALRITGQPAIGSPRLVFEYTVWR